MSLLQDCEKGVGCQTGQEDADVAEVARQIKVKVSLFQDSKHSEGSSQPRRDVTRRMRTKSLKNVRRGARCLRIGYLKFGKTDGVS
jgi:hypothetical protein